MTRLDLWARGVALVALLAAACTTPDPAPPDVPRAIVGEHAVRSVFFPEAPATCPAAPCAGSVPSEYMSTFRHALEAAGFDVVTERDVAPTARILVDHVATTQTECDMVGTIYLADNAIDVKRTFEWRRSAAPRADLFAPEIERRVLDTCLAQFAGAARQALMKSR